VEIPRRSRSPRHDPFVKWSGPTCFLPSPITSPSANSHYRETLIGGMPKMRPPLSCFGSVKLLSHSQVKLVLASFDSYAPTLRFRFPLERPIIPATCVAKPFTSQCRKMSLDRSHKNRASWGDYSTLHLALCTNAGYRWRLNLSEVANMPLFLAPGTHRRASASPAKIQSFVHEVGPRKTPNCFTAAYCMQL
jgi:hypothetical protein